MKKVVIAMSVLLVSSIVDAAPIMVIGAGSYSCGKHTASNEVEKSVDLQWVLGFLAAKSFEKNVDLMNGMDARAIAGALNLYCQKAPLDMMLAAATDIYNQLLARATKR